MWWYLLACAPIETGPSTSATWAGWVLVDLPDSGVTDVMDGGSFEVLDVDGAPLAEGEQPYGSSNPGWWQVDVPIDTEVAIHLQGGGADSPSGLPALTPTVWRGHTPDARAYWLDGGLFVRDLDYTDAFFESLSALPGVSAELLSDGQIAHLWGEPLVPEDWAGATISVVDGDEEEIAVHAFSIDADGLLSESSDERVDLFVAVNLAPGPVTLTVDAPGHATAQTTWPTRGGDLVSAMYYALPEDSP